MRRSIRLAIVGCAVALASGARAADAEERAKLPLVSRTIMLLKDHYLDPQRFEPKKMVAAAVESVADAVDELTMEGDAGGTALTLRMGADTHEVALAPVTSIWAIRPALQEALRFVRERTSIDAVELESAAIAGMLSTLDPGTTVLGPAETSKLTASIRGEFGGLGFVVGIRRGRLTVVQVLAGTPVTPAEQLGIRRGDVIGEIDGRSTIGVPLERTVEWIRGPIGSEIAVEWTRPGERPARATVKRDRIHLRVISGQLLPGGVAYVRVAEFPPTTHKELLRELQAQAARAPEGLRGVILDLRDSPGGMLSAGVDVADVFLSEGDLLAQFTAAGVVGDTKVATPSPSDVRAPVVVLVNGSTAGSAEIAAAALRENGRAILVGQRTFGLGSFPQLLPLGVADEPTLKLTFGAYHTPDKRRFDRVGLEPDVVVRPGCITGRTSNLFGPEQTGAGDAAAPLGTLTELVAEERLDPERRAADPTSCEPRRDERRPDEDAALAFAAEVLRRTTTPDREGLLAAAAALLPERRAAHEAELAARLGTLGIDWRRAESVESPTVNVAAAGPAGGVVAAGAPVSWTVTVENRGSGPLARLRAWTVAPHAPFLDGRELVFGTIAPGAKKSFTLELHPAGDDVTPRRDEVTLRFAEENGHAPPDAAVRFEVRKVLRPRLALQARLGCAGPRCARVAAGAALKVDVALTNSGRAPAPRDLVVMLEPLDERWYVTDGWREVGAVAPGAPRRAPLALRLADADGDERARFRVTRLTGDERTTCALDLAIGARLPLVRECRSPALRLAPDPDAGPVVATGDRFRLEGTASEGDGADPLRKVTVRLGGRKVLAQRAGEGAKTIAFSTELRLGPGENLVVVRAETQAGNVVVQPMRIYR